MLVAMGCNWWILIRRVPLPCFFFNCEHCTTLQYNNYNTFTTYKTLPTEQHVERWMSNSKDSRYVRDTTCNALWVRITLALDPFIIKRNSDLCYVLGNYFQFLLSIN